MSDVKEIKFAYWYVTHKLLLQRLVLIFLIAVTSIVWIIALTILIRQYGVFQKGNAFALQTLPFDLVAFENYHGAHVPVLPQVVSKQVIKTRDNQYDLILRLKNPNSHWLVTFDYSLVGQGFETAKQSGFLLPGEERDILVLGYKSATAITQFNPDITEIFWQRTENTEEFVNERFQFSVVEDSMQFTQSVGSNNQRVSTLRFKMRNNSAYSYWNVGFNVRLMRGGRPMTVNQITANSFYSEEVKEFEVNWFENLPQIASPDVSIEPIINIFDEGTYIQPRG